MRYLTVLPVGFTLNSLLNSNKRSPPESSPHIDDPLLPTHCVCVHPVLHTGEPPPEPLDLKHL